MKGLMRLEPSTILVRFEFTRVMKQIQKRQHSHMSFCGFLFLLFAYAAILSVALPSVLNETDDDVTTWRRPPTRVNDSTISFAARSASAASASSSTPSSSSSAHATLAAAPKSSVTAFAPPQLAGRRANVVTEDVAAWNRAKKAKTAAAEPVE